MQYQNCILLFAVTAFASVGCTPSEDPATVNARAKLLLSAEPDGGVGVLEAREKLAESNQLVVVGTIGASDATWDPGKAVFTMTDPEIASHGPGHDPDNCPFCKARKEKTPDATAIVQVLDEQGEILNVDARQVLQAEPGQTVVVVGTGEINPLGSLVVSADKIFVRR